jgi:hypothetical protein
MKQHITPKQLNELSEKGRKKLFKYIRTRESLNETPMVAVLKVFEDKQLMLLSIGQLIEFLDEKGKLRLTIGGGKLKAITWKFEEEILCDLLWESVKEILNA